MKITLFDFHLQDSTFKVIQHTRIDRVHAARSFFDPVALAL